VLHARLSIDLGGIAKGFAVDRAIDAMRAAGCHAGVVNAGGDLAVFGADEHDVLYRDRRGAAVVKLLNAALATSEIDSCGRPAEHRGYYNGVDHAAIASGRVTVTAPCAAVADALTICLLIEGAPHVALLDEFGARRLGDRYRHENADR
jgi:thiamine biosynthesis lipoprotein